MCHGFLKEAPSPPPQGLGAIDCGVGALQQQFGGARMLGKHANPHAHPDHHLQPVRRTPGLAHGPDQVARHGSGAIRVAQLAHHHRQLIARHAPQHITRAQSRLHLPRNVLEHLIARGMAIAVVHVLETVQIEQQHRHALAAFARLLHGQPHLMTKPAAIGQTRESILVRHVLQPLLLRLFFGDIDEHAHVMRNFASQIAYHRQRHVLGKDLAVLAAVPDLALPVARLGNGCPHGFIKSLVVAARLEGARRFTQQLFFGVTQQTGKRCID